VAELLCMTSRGVQQVYTCEVAAEENLKSFSSRVWKKKNGAFALSRIASSLFTFGIPLLILATGEYHRVLAVVMYFRLLLR
jgi:hypothetical protein